MRNDPISVTAAWLLACAAAILVAGAAPAQISYGQFNVPLPMIQRSVLANVQGRVGHLAVDPVSDTLYVAAPGNGTLEALEIPTSTQRTPITLPSPQDVLMLPERRRLILSCGDGAVIVFAVNESGELTEERRVSFAGEADALAFDEATGTVHVVHGRNVGSFEIETGDTEESVSVKGPGLLEALVLSGDARRAFTNLPSAGEVVVIDLAEREVAERWTLPDGAKGNAALAVDRDRGRLFVAARNPAKAFVLDAATGEPVATLEAPEDADDAWYDPVLKRLYVSGGGGRGAVFVYQQTLGEGDAAETYALEHRETTNSGARTSVLDSAERRLIVAAPAIGGDPTFLYIYLIGP